MAEVVHKVAPTTEGIDPMGMIYSIGQNWGYIVFALIAITLAIIVYVLIAKMDDERHERDDPVYEGYKNLMRDCTLGRSKEKIRKHYSLMNLLWFGIPLKKKENSNVLVDYLNKPLGYYRGHSYSQDGYLNFLAYKNKYLLFFEDIFLLRCPLKIDVVLKMRDKDGKIVKDSDDKPKTTIRTLDYSKWVGELKNGDMKIQCTGLQKLSYFRFPVYLDKEGEVVDIRKELKQDIVDLSHDQMLTRILSTGAQMVDKAMLHNPNVKYAQLAPEKTKTEIQEEQAT